jgi:hypothetical protein
VVLTIANYTPRPGESFTLFDFLLPIITMQRLEILTIDNVTLVPAPSPHPTTLQSRSLQALHLTDIHTFEAIVEILGVLGDSPYLFLTRCAIGDPRVPFGGATDLSWTTLIPSRTLSRSSAAGKAIFYK